MGQDLTGSPSGLAASPIPPGPRSSAWRGLLLEAFTGVKTEWVIRLKRVQEGARNRLVSSLAPVRGRQALTGCLFPHATWLLVARRLFFFERLALPAALRRPSVPSQHAGANLLIALRDVLEQHRVAELAYAGTTPYRWSSASHQACGQPAVGWCRHAVAYQSLTLPSASPARKTQVVLKVGATTAVNKYPNNLLLFSAPMNICIASASDPLSRLSLCTSTCCTSTALALALTPLRPTHVCRHAQAGVAGELLLLPAGRH